MIQYKRCGKFLCASFDCFAPGMWVKCCIQRVCMYVSKAIISVHVAVTRSSFDDSEIRYVLLVLWTKSCCHLLGTVGQNRA